MATHEGAPSLLGRLRPGRRAALVGWTAVYGGTALGTLSGATWGLLRAEARLARRTIGTPTDDAPLASGSWGRDRPGTPPLRLAVPWKYGFKSIKSIVKIRFVDKEPPTTWNLANAREYGFYSNVNPNRDHPRWSQREEQRLGGGFLGQGTRMKTDMYNGYGAQVSSLYNGMDLIRNY